MSPESIEPFPAIIKRLADDRGISVSQVGYTAYDPNVKGTNPDTFKSVMAGRRKVTIVLMEAVARALKVAPEEFAEYRLALARQALDESEVGLDDAVANLSRLEAALRPRALARAPRAAEPPAGDLQPSRAARRGRSTPREG